MYSVGVDIGGMSIKVGLVNEKGEIVASNREKTACTPELCIKNLENQIQTLLDEFKLRIEDVAGIGIGCPGAVSVNTGVVEFLPNLNWKKVPLADVLKKKFNTCVKLSNDANVATLAEVVYGVAKGYNSAVMFTLGTGVGGGMVIDKKLYEGENGRGAELGHTTLALDGIPCSCGRKGCVECYVSATALMNQTKRAMLEDKDSLMWSYLQNDIEKVDGKTAFDCEKQGDKSAKKVVDNYVKYLSESILSMLNIFRPEVFILGGGVSAQGTNLTDRVTEYLEKFDYGYKFAPKTKIVTAKLGNDAGIIGASALVR